MPKFSGFIVDDFLDDPMDYRANILKLPFIPPNEQGVGGLAWRCSMAIEDSLIKKLERIWRIKIAPLKAEVRYTFESSSIIADKRGGICHTDAGVSDFTAVIYLTLPNYCQGGTSFYEHLPSGAVEFVKSMSRGSFKKIEDWDCYFNAKMRFNRMVTYRSSLFHGISRPFFGSSVEDARMIMSIRFNKV